MPAIVSGVTEDSIADELGIEAGDELISIDNTKMLDMIDYNFLCKSDFLTLDQPLPKLFLKIRLTLVK